MKNKINSKLNNNEMPNKTTFETYKEIEDMERNPSYYKSYSSVDSLMNDLLD